MINLKLAEYNKEGKFLRFLELGIHFVYGGNYIDILDYRNDSGISIVKGFKTAKKDETDPLNRFHNHFHGRTYGNGQYVLIYDDKDDVKEGYRYDEKYIGFEYNFRDDPEARWCSLGNLHENPELYEKVRDKR